MLIAKTYSALLLFREVFSSPAGFGGKNKATELAITLTQFFEGFIGVICLSLTLDIVPISDLLKACAHKLISANFKPKSFTQFVITFPFLLQNY